MKCCPHVRSFTVSYKSSSPPLVDTVIEFFITASTLPKIVLFSAVLTNKVPTNMLTELGTKFGRIIIWEFFRRHQIQFVKISAKKAMSACGF